MQAGFFGATGGIVNAFEELGLERRLEISDGALREAFRAAGAKCHPDAGGSEAGFARIREAHAVLASPSRRLRCWLETGGISCDPRGSIGGGLMDLFGRISTATEAATALARRRTATRSALALALLEGETQRVREEIEMLTAETEERIFTCCADFPAVEAGGFSDPGQLVRDLAFLEKWRRTLRETYARLIS